MVLNNNNNNTNNTIINSTNQQLNQNLNAKLANMLKMSMNGGGVAPVSTPTNLKPILPMNALSQMGSMSKENSSSGGGGGKILSNEDKKINLNALKNQDPFATNIIDTALRVAVYKFVSKKNEWKKLDVEGSLFLFERMVEPLHSFVVMNTLALNLFLQPITSDLEFQDRNPFLLYKSNNDIYGIWFIDKEDCDRIKSLILSLTDSAKERRNKREKSKMNLGVQGLTTENVSSPFTPESTHSNLVTPISMPMSSSIATNQLSFNQLISLTSSSSNVNSENNNNNNKQVDIMQMLTKAQVQYNNNSNMKAILEPPTSHSTPGSLSTQALVGTHEPSSASVAEPKPIAQWPHDLFLNSNQFIKPEPLRRATTNGVSDNGQQQQQSNNSLNTSSSISGGITCSPPSSTSSSVASSSSSASSSSATSNNQKQQQQSTNALLNLLMSSASSSTFLDNGKKESSTSRSNGLPISNKSETSLSSTTSLNTQQSSSSAAPSATDLLSLELKRQLNIKSIPSNQMSASVTPTHHNVNAFDSILNTNMGIGINNPLPKKSMTVQDFEENLLNQSATITTTTASSNPIFYLPNESMNTTSTTTANTSTEYINQNSLKFPLAKKKDHHHSKSKTSQLKKMKAAKISSHNSSSSNSAAGISSSFDSTSSSSTSTSEDDDETGDECSDSPNTLPLLLTPAAFESSSTASSIISSSTFNNNNNNQHFFSSNDILNLSNFNNNNDFLNTAPSMLTKSQLQQSLIYLLNNDDQFLNTLHQAYVKSSIKSQSEVNKNKNLASNFGVSGFMQSKPISSANPVNAAAITVKTSSSYASSLNKQH